ncbi:MAG: MBL fold metallo-hydrolase [bacterium]
MNKKFSVIFILVYLVQFYLGYSLGEKIRVSFLDVGQGDSILVQLHGDYDILVDGGEGNSVIIELGKLMAPWNRKIEVMILTHPHLDHIGGLIEVLDRFDVEEVWLYPIGYKTPEFLIIATQILSDIKDVIIRYPYKGYSDSIRNLSLRIIWPSTSSQYSSNVDLAGLIMGHESKTTSKSSFSGNKVNNSSLVLLLEYGEFSILLPGDAEIEAEDRYVIGLGSFSPISVVKAGHHCSRTASSEKLLSVIDPELVICSFGKGNKFGHPHSETISRFKSMKIPYLSTMEEGTISIESDGNSWWLL